MKRLLSAAAVTAAATAAFTGAAAAEGSFSGNVALTTDYVFRGISQTQDEPAIQGGFDYSNGIFYAGTWASNVNFGDAGPISVDVPLEIDLYGGVRPVVGPVTLDFGVIYYAYPGADETLLASGEFDYVEGKIGASIAPVEGLTLGGNLYYSPEFPGDGGDALYVEGTASFAPSDVFSISGGVANQSVDLAGYFVTTTGAVDNYTTWNVGGTISKFGFGLDVRYYDTDEDILNLAGEVVSDERVVVTLKRTL
jgi:uncharacterized protein (TIGR02001 family)